MSVFEWVKDVTAEAYELELYGFAGAVRSCVWAVEMRIGSIANSSYLERGVGCRVTGDWTKYD